MTDDIPERYKAAIEAARHALLAQARPQVSFEALGGGSPGLMSSRVGGPIAWHPESDVPKSRSGAPLFLALQIELAGLDPLPGFPTAGVMQLYLADDILERGITFLPEHRNPGDYPLQQGDGFRLVVHRETSSLVAHPQLSSDADYPVLAPEARDRAIALDFARATDHTPPISHWQGAPIYQAFEALADEDDDFDPEWAVEALWGEWASANHLGGYAQPLQLDHRSFYEEFRRYDRCLINIQDMPGLEMGDLNLSVLINDDDLTAGRFEDVILMADTD